MAVIGYKRVSSISQSTERQDLGELDKLFEEKLSGKSASDRPALLAMIDYARDGDTVRCHSIDRLARDLRDLQSIISQLNDKGVAITFLSENLTFSAGADDAFAKLQLQMMGAFAEFERNIIRKRQAEGIAKAQQRGVYKNRVRKTVIDRDQVKALKSEGLSTYKIAERMNISRMSVHRILNLEKPIDQQGNDMTNKIKTDRNEEPVGDKWSTPTSSYDDAMAIKRYIKKSDAVEQKDAQSDDDTS
jgi:DNA invertase Pin-like site-specific DNA recombinase